LAARSRKLLRGALRGLGVALAGSAGIAFAITGLRGSQVAAEMDATKVMIATVITVICCVAAGAMFGHLAEQRHRRAYGEDD